MKKSCVQSCGSPCLVGTCVTFYGSHQASKVLVLLRERDWILEGDDYTSFRMHAHWQIHRAAMAPENSLDEFVHLSRKVTICHHRLELATQQSDHSLDSPVHPIHTYPPPVDSRTSHQQSASYP